MRLLTIIAALLMTTHTAMSDVHGLDDRQTILVRGEQAFEHGNAMRNNDPQAASASFQEAAEAWTALIEDGVLNGPLLYNLGNALFLSGDTSGAIAAYLRAASLTPDDARLADNLAHVRAEVRPKFASDPTALSGLLHWVTSRPETWILFGFAAGWCGLWGTLIVRSRRPFAGARSLLAAAGTLTIVSAAVAGVQASQAEHPLAVISADNVVVRKGDAASYEPQFAETLQAGVECRILQPGPWAHIQLANGQTGWVPSSDLVEVGNFPPPGYTHP